MKTGTVCMWGFPFARALVYTVRLLRFRFLCGTGVWMRIWMLWKKKLTLPQNILQESV